MHCAEYSKMQDFFGFTLRKYVIDCIQGKCMVWEGGP